MLETPHVVVGIALATKFQNPIIAVPLALASHFVLDKVPHWNPHTFTETMKSGHPSKSTIAITLVDITIALISGLTFAYTALPNQTLALTILTCCFASVLPDVSKYPFFLFKATRQGVYRKWVEYERSLQVETARPFLGILSQVVTILVALYFI